MLLSSHTAARLGSPDEAAQSLDEVRSVLEASSPAVLTTSLNVPVNGCEKSGAALFRTPASRPSPPTMLTGVSSLAPLLRARVRVCARVEGSRAAGQPRRFGVPVAGDEHRCVERHQRRRQFGYPREAETTLILTDR